ncbi:multiple epidermal growth factor-like domains protein 11 [Octopus sinensis]|uniref:Multiple epidermal growth factor-like domains protein 11 n=1 Tax=Octopus sinensis TaxID=2607531 RepID=A0A6P7TE18_9MOLL|nr:multiple epidermal growth factor-like domains protein 11 [Octopus sinensis]
MATTSALMFFAVGIFMVGWNGPTNIAGAADCNIATGDCVTDAPQKKGACFEACSRIPEGCKKNVDRFGKQQKYQCHCKELKECDFANDGTCAGECLEGYSGPNCQQRLYHKFIEKGNPTHGHLFRAQNKKCADLPLKVHFYNLYRINTIMLTIEDLNDEINVTAGQDDKLSCVLTSDTTLKCQGDSFTDSLNIQGTGMCVRNIQLLGCPPELYGENCLQKCNCMNGSTCHQLRGACQDGCETGWHGDDCQSPNYENVAKGKFAFISNVFSYPKTVFSDGICEEKSVTRFANLSIDGIYDSSYQHAACASSKWMKRPFWYVVFDQSYPINQIRIYNTDTYRSRLKGFVVLVDPSVCLESRNDEHLQDVIDVKCEKVKYAIRVIILLPVDWGQLSLCEVEVLQCLPGFYGVRCKEFCDLCYENRCDQFSGDCTDGCVTGYNWNKTTSLCEECERGTFGQNCSRQCNCFDNTECHHVTGVCPDGCPDGYKLPDCQEETAPLDITLIVTLAVLGVLLLVCVIIICCWCYKRGKTREDKSELTTSSYVTMNERDHQKNSFQEERTTTTTTTASETQ